MSERGTESNLTHMRKSFAGRFVLYAGAIWVVALLLSGIVGLINPTVGADAFWKVLTFGLIAACIGGAIIAGVTDQKTPLIGFKRK